MIVRVDNVDGDTVKVTTNCDDCTKLKTVNVKTADFIKWKQGELIQRAFPYLTEDQRCNLLGPICGTCFDIIFPDVDEPEYNYEG